MGSSTYLKISIESSIKIQREINPQPPLKVVLGAKSVSWPIDIGIHTSGKECELAQRPLVHVLLCSLVWTNYPVLHLKFLRQKNYMERVPD